MAALPELPTETYLAWVNLVRAALADAGPSPAGITEAIVRRIGDEVLGGVQGGHRTVAPRVAMRRSAARQVIATLERLAARSHRHPDLAARWSAQHETSWLINLALRRAGRGLGAPAHERAHEPAEPERQAAPGGRVSVMAVDDDDAVRTVLDAMLGTDDRLSLVGIVADVAAAIALAGARTPQVALVDVRMPAGGGPRATRGIKALAPETRVLAYSAFSDRHAVLEMLRAGADGYLVKGTTPDKLGDAIVRASRGEHVMSELVAEPVLSELSERVAVEETESRDLHRRRAAVRRFVAGRGVTMAWQPIADLADGQVVGAEGLARFSAEPAVPPDVWIAEAWRLDMGFELEIALLKLAVEHLERMPEEVFVSLNLSPDALLHSDFPSATEDLPWKRIVLEITEQVPVHDYVLFLAPLELVRSRGGRIAVDDAGSGYSSLRHIVEIAPDLIKLDRQVTAGIGGDRRRHAMAVALISFAEELGAEVIAEGIEERTELQSLRKMRVRYGQGILLSGLPSSDDIDDAMRGRIREALLELL